MSYQTSHGLGGGPFKPNKDRGFWSSPHDFALACLNNAMRVDSIHAIAIVPMVVTNGFFHLLLLFLNGLLYAVPVFFIQSFLGQFSSSGYISALRISPLFKGIGYVAVAANIISLSLHGALIAIPVIFFIHSLQPTLPWSCDAPHPWDKKLHLTVPTNVTEIDVIMEVYISPCALNYSLTDKQFSLLLVPSVEFFRHQLSGFNVDMFGCVLVVWAAVAYVAYQGFDKIGIFFRRSTIAVMSLLVVLFIRMLFLPDILKHLTIERPYYTSSSWVLAMVLPAITMFMTFGPGAGSVMTLASYNTFKTDIVKYTWQVPLCQIVVLILLGMVSFCAEMHLIKDRNIELAPFNHQWMIFMTIPSTLSMMDLSHLWTWMFLIMIILGAFNLTIIQMLSVQTAIFDEFEQLRPFRREVIFGGAAGLGLISAFFCTTHGLNAIEMVVDMNQFNQAFLNVILMVVVLWVYGHDRFRRDIEFITSRVMSGWVLNYIRIGAPIFLGIILFISFVYNIPYYLGLEYAEILITFCVSHLPWLALPAYCAYRLRLAIGDWKLRLSRCVQATDWFPVDPEDKQRYDEMFSNKEASQALATNLV